MLYNQSPRQMFIAVDMTTITTWRISTVYGPSESLGYRITSGYTNACPTGSNRAHYRERKANNEMKTSRRNIEHKGTSNNACKKRYRDVKFGSSFRPIATITHNLCTVNFGSTDNSRVHNRDEILWVNTPSLNRAKWTQEVTFKWDD